MLVSELNTLDGQVHSDALGGGGGGEGKGVVSACIQQLQITANRHCQIQAAIIQCLSLTWK